MHPLFGDWYRKVRIEPKNDDLVARWKAVEAFTKKVDTPKLIDLTACLAGINETAVPMLEQFRQELLSADAAFPMRDNDAEMQVLCGAALVAVIAQNNTSSDIAAMLIDVSCVSPFRKPMLLPDVGDLAEQHLDNRSIAIRALANRPKVTGFKHDQLIEAVKTACASNSAAQLGAPLEAALNGLSQSLLKVAQATDAALDALDKADRVQAEEANVLWWLYAGFSRDLQKPISDLAAEVSCLVSGKELADLTKFSPGLRAAVAYLGHCLQASASKRLSVTDVITAATEEWLAKLPLESKVTGLCPLMFILNERRQGHKVADCVSRGRKRFGLANVNHSPVEFAVQCYRELVACRAVLAN
jgi:hypothetical protein